MAVSFKDNVLAWLSSGGAYYLIAFLWLITAVAFGAKAREIGIEKDSKNDGCYLMVSTTVFVMMGGAIGLLLFQKLFPWYIITSWIGSALGPMLAIRTFKFGKRKY